MKYLLIFAIIILVSCSSGSKPMTTPASSFVLKLNDKQKTSNIVITLKDVKESRCPMNARCIRAGEAVAILNVVIDNKNERNISLCTGPDCGVRSLYDTYTLFDNDQKYLFRLDSITPDPAKTLEKREQQVYFTVSQSK